MEEHPSNGGVDEGAATVLGDVWGIWSRWHLAGAAEKVHLLTSLKGKSEVWQALRMICCTEMDLDTARCILDSVGVILPTGLLNEIYDTSGYRYMLPAICVCDPNIESAWTPMINAAKCNDLLLSTHSFSCTYTLFLFLSHFLLHTCSCTHFLLFNSHINHFQR